MGSARLDVLSLFRHYGLDPADYLDASELRARSRVQNPGQSQRWAERDLFDYRNFDLATDTE